MKRVHLPALMGGESFRDWRRSRPFWGGVTAILAGIEIYGVTAAPFKVMVVQGIAGVSSLMIGILLIGLALITWFQPHLRVVTGMAIVVLALASILLTNLGGFVIGMLLALHSGASIASWRVRDGDSDGERKSDESRTSAETDDKTGLSEGQEDVDSDQDPEQDSDDVPEPRGGLGRPSSRRSRRLGGQFDRFGVAVLASTLLISGTPSAELAQASAPVPAASGFCTIFPWLCPAEETMPSTEVPDVPELGLPKAPTLPALPAAPANATCDPTKMPSGSVPLGSSKATAAAGVLRDCLTAQKAGDAPQSKTAGSPGGTVSVPMAHLVATKQTMSGLAYHGVTTLQTAKGTIRVLKFTASTVLIEGMVQDVALPLGTMVLSVGATATLSGNVEMYVATQSGKAFGLLPLTLSPESPPPLVIPSMVFTDVDSQIAYLVADTLTVPKTTIVAR